MKRRLNSYISLIILLVGAGIIALLAPREKKFKYSFTEGKPWAYELLTAPYDFPILKTDADLEAEKDSVRTSIKPYLYNNEKIQTDAIQRWRTAYRGRWHNTVSETYFAYIDNQLRVIYQTGIISDTDLNDIKNNGYEEVNLQGQDRLIHRVPLSRFYTVKEAYLTIIDGAPQGLNRDVLERIDINDYLEANTALNKEMTEEVTQDELQNISLSTGIIQTGERIVDRGDIVDKRTYNILNSFKYEYENRSGDAITRWAIPIATFVLVYALFVMFLLFLRLFRPHFVVQIKNMVFITVIIVLLVIVTEMALSYRLFNIYVIPYAMLPIMARTFFDSRTAMFAHIVCILAASLFVPYPLEFVITQMMAGMAAVFSLRSLTSRASLIRTTFLVFLTYVALYFTFTIWQDGKIASEHLNYILYFAINLIFLMFTYLLVYLVERVFGYVSVISLVELSDMNSPLLKQLSEIAPGTFQHSYQVSILAMEAGTRIGADAQLLRTGALYHDIGKMKNPSYFTENQGAYNPHNALPYEESACIIIRHVTDGIALAQRHKLPTVIIDFIRTHHGKGTTKYFYNSYCNEHPDQYVDPAPFTYPGPNPFSREMAILMLADSVEASSRSLKEYTEESIRTLIDRIVDGIVADGLLNDAPITFRDIRTAKEVFLEKLKTFYHSRTAYPEKKA